MKKLNKFVAVAAAASMTLSSAAVPVLAEEASGSFKETLRGLYTEQIEKFSEYYTENYNSFDGPMSADANVTLTPGAGALALIGATGLDLSWLQNVKISTNMQGLEDKIYAVINAAVNDTTIVSAEELYDLANQICYYRVPELIEQNLSVDMAKAIELIEASAPETAAEIEQGLEETDPALGEIAGEVDVDESSAAAVAMLKFITSFHSIKEFQALLPAPELATSLLTTYSDLVIDHVTDVSAEPAQVTAGSVTVDATAYKGTMGTTELLALVNDGIAALKENEDVKALFDQYSAMIPEMSYDDFIASLDQAADEIGAATPEDLGDMNLELTMYVDADGKVVGEDEIMTVDGESFEVKFYVPANETKSALSLEIVPPAEIAAEGITSITVNGEGDVANGAVTGNYVVAVNGTDVANIAAENVAYDEAAGTCSGTLTLSAIVPEDTEDQTLMMLSMFTAQLTWDGSADSVNCSLSVLMSGSEIATLAFDAVDKKGADVAIPEVSEFDPAVDMMDQAAFEEVVSTIDPTVLIGKLTEAGMPAEFIDQVMAMANGGSSTDAYGEKSVAEPITDDEVSVAEPIPAEEAPVAEVVPAA